MEFKQLVKKRREMLHLTLEEVGKRTGVSKATVQRWESGEIENVRRDKIVKLAKALETTPAYLMGWEEQKENVRDIFASNLRTYMKEKNVKIDQISEITGKKSNEIESWLEAKTSPTIDDVKTLADYFKVSVDQFEKANDIFQLQSAALSNKEKQIIDMYRSMSDGNKEAVFTLIKNLSNK